MWGCAYTNKYIEHVDSFFRRAYSFGYTNGPINNNDVINERDYKLWNKIVSNTDNPLNKLAVTTKEDKMFARAQA